MTELKACPFCGSCGDIESQPSYSQAANTYARYRGWCDQCGFGLDWHSHEADAITAWNTRHPTPAADEVEAGDAAFLHDLADRLCKVPCTHHDGHDIDRLRELASALQARSAEPDGRSDIWTDRALGTWHPGDEA